jgi:tRNA(Ile)-lysidine synthase
LAEAGIAPESLAGLAAQAGGVRAVREDDAADLSARAVFVSPAGFARLNRDVVLRAPAETGLRVLDRVLRMIAGNAYPPRGDRLDRLWTDMRAGLEARRSLGGCLIAPVRDGWLVQREPAGLPAPVPCGAGTVRWDGRFTLVVGGRGRALVGPLGQKGWLAVKKQVAAPPFPASVAQTLPALQGEAGEPVDIPHLHWRKAGFHGLSMVDMAFAPDSPLTGGLVWHQSGTMC